MNFWRKIKQLVSNALEKMWCIHRVSYSTASLIKLISTVFTRYCYCSIYVKWCKICRSVQIKSLTRYVYLRVDFEAFIGASNAYAGLEWDKKVFTFLKSVHWIEIFVLLCLFVNKYLSYVIRVGLTFWSIYLITADYRFIIYTSFIYSMKHKIFFRKVSSLF